jgi:hypothetical protein
MTERTGLQQMTNRRQAASGAGRAVRDVPAPKHPRVYVEQPEIEAPQGEPETTTEAPEPVEAASPLVARRSVKDRPARGVAEAREDAAAAPKRSRVRQTPVQLDEASDRHLSALKREAILAELPYSASAVLRLALHELVRARGYDGILAELAENPTQMRVAPPSGRA